jgi:hypothetical protein
VKPQLIMPPAESPLRQGKHSLTRIAAYLLGVTTAAFVLFQMKASFGSNALSLNLADPFAVLSFAAVFLPTLTHHELPKWESRMFNLSLALFCVALLVAFIVGYFKIGATAWAIGGRLTGYIVVLGYLGAGYLIAHQWGRRGFVIVSRILGITASSVTVRATSSSARSGWRGEYVHANSGPSVQTILTSDRCNS